MGDNKPEKSTKPGTILIDLNYAKDSIPVLVGKGVAFNRVADAAATLMGVACQVFADNVLEGKPEADRRAAMLEMYDRICMTVRQISGIDRITIEGEKK